MRLVFLRFTENLLRGSAWNQYRHQITSHIAIPYPEERQMCIISAPSSPSRSYPLFLELVCHGEVPKYTSVLMDWEHLSQKQSACVRKVTARRNVEARSRRPRPREQLLPETGIYFSSWDGIKFHSCFSPSLRTSPPVLAYSTSPIHVVPSSLSETAHLDNSDLFFCFSCSLAASYLESCLALLPPPTF